MNSILNELKRRNIFRATASYAIVSWMLIQAASVIFPAFDAPPWVLKVLLLFIAAGFPLVIVLAWAYELTPQGIKRTADVTVERAERSDVRVIDSILIITLIAALGITTALGFLPGGISTVTAAIRTSDNGPAKAPRLAIMPFVTLNTGPDVVALADGFSDNIYSRLIGAARLDLVGVASTLRAAEEKQTRSEVANSLDADYLVEGSVRLNGDRVHVFAQLVTLPKGDPVWSHDFDQNRNGVEAIQSSISTAVAHYFGLKLAARALANHLPGDVFNRWQEAVGLLRAGGEKNLRQARVLLKGIIEHAPKFGPAHAALAWVMCEDPAPSNPPDFHDKMNAVESLLNDAMSLAPQSRRVLLWRARSESLLERWRGRNDDFERINRQFEQALGQYPGDSDLLAAYAAHALAWDDTEKAIDLATRALKADPLSTLARRTRVEALIRSGQYDLAGATITNLEPGKLALRLSARLAIAQGNLRQAADAYSKISGDGEKMPMEAARVWATLGDMARANQVIKSQEPEPMPAIWKLALDNKYADAYALASDKLQPDEPRSALLLGVLAVQAGKDDAARQDFSRFFSGWVHDAGPLRGTAALRYAPWYAKALMDSGDETDARTLLDRHLAGVILAQEGLSPAESSLYLAANFAVARRRADAENALAQAINGGLRLTRGALGDPVDLKQSELFAKLRRANVFSKMM